MKRAATGFHCNDCRVNLADEPIKLGAAQFLALDGLTFFVDRMCLKHALSAAGILMN